MYNEDRTQSRGRDSMKAKQRRDKARNLKRNLGSSSADKLPPMKRQSPVELPPPEPEPVRAPGPGNKKITRMRKPLPSRKQPLQKKVAPPVLQLDEDLKRLKRQFDKEDKNFVSHIEEFSEEMELRAPNRAPRTLNLGDLSLLTDRPQPLWNSKEDPRVPIPVSLESPEWHVHGGDKYSSRAIKLVEELNADDPESQLIAAKKLQAMLSGVEYNPSEQDQGAPQNSEEVSKKKKKKKKKKIQPEMPIVPDSIAALEDMWRTEKEHALREIAARREIRKALSTPPTEYPSETSKLSISETFRDKFYDLDIDINIEMERINAIKPQQNSEKKNDGKFWERWLTSEYDWQMTKKMSGKPTQLIAQELETEPELGLDPEPEPEVKAEVELIQYIEAFQVQSEEETQTKIKRKKKPTAEERIRKLSPLCRFSRTGKLKMTLEATLDLMYDIYEKKCIADEADEAAGNTADAMVHFLEDYFMQKFGLKEMAEQKLGDYIVALFHYEGQHRRIPPFLHTIGLQDEWSFSRLPGDLMSCLLKRAFKGQFKSIAEQLDEDPDYVEQARAVDMVIGFEAKRAASADWDCPQLEKVASKTAIDAMLRDIESLPAIKIKGVLKVDLDDVFDIVMTSFIGWCKNCIDELSSAWESEAKTMRESNDAEEEGNVDSVSTDDRTVGEIGFIQIARTFCSSTKGLSSEELHRLWKELLKHLGYNEGDGIDHPMLFAVGMMQLGLVPKQIEGEAT